MITIGLTGGSGAGKGVVSKIFMEFGVPSIDTDGVYREIVSYNSSCMKELREYFGDEIANENGSLNRAVMSEIVFAPGAYDKLNALNRITHKYILEECGIQLAIFSESGYKMAIVDAPQLYESGFAGKCEYVIAVLAHPELRIMRIMERDSISRDKALARIEAQKNDDFFESRADFIIYNNGNTDNLRYQIDSIIKEISGETTENGYSDYI